jgi:hypothetical protein
MPRLESAWCFLRGPEPCDLTRVASFRPAFLNPGKKPLPWPEAVVFILAGVALATLAWQLATHPPDDDSGV